MTRPKISALLFCCDTEVEIKKTILNLSFANEIIVLTQTKIDDFNFFSAEQGFQMVQEDLNKAALQKKGIEIAQNDWLLMMDSNQLISEELALELQQEISKNSKSLYSARESLFFFGKTLKYGAFLNKKKTILFNRKAYSYPENANNLSEHCSGKSTLLKNRISSYSYKGFDDYNSKLNVIRQEEALLLFNHNVKPNFYHFLFKPFFNFINQYFLKFGLIEGREGFILAYINSFSILKRYLILWLLYRDME